MFRTSMQALFIAAMATALPAAAHQEGIAKPKIILKETAAGMPHGEQQEISVITADIKPGERTVFHTHRFPVTVYVLEGTFTLELEGRPPMTAKAGQAIIEPPRVKMTGYNQSASELLRVVIFYVSEPGMPFLDPTR